MLHMLKSTSCFFFLYFLSLPIFVYSQEKQLQFELVDSTEIQFPELEKILSGPNTVKHYNNCIYILKLYNDTLHKIDLATGVHSVIVMDIRREMKRHFYPSNFIITNNLIHLITANGSEILRINTSGKIINKIRLKQKNGFYPTIYSHFMYLKKEDQYMLPIETNINMKDYRNKTKKLLAYYSREGLFGRFDSKGNLIATLGQYDTLFHTGHYQQMDWYEGAYSPNNLIISQYFSPQVEIISLNTNSSRKIQVPGLNADAHYILRPIERRTSRETYNTVEVESNQYYSLKALVNDSLYCRTYAVAIEDTTTNPMTLTPEVPPKNTCGYRTPRELRQKTLLQIQKTYFQIFDLNSTVLYDGVRPFRGFVLNDLNSNMILTGLRYTNRMVIYRYKIVS